MGRQRREAIKHLIPLNLASEAETCAPGLRRFQPPGIISNFESRVHRGASIPDFLHRNNRRTNDIGTGLFILHREGRQEIPGLEYNILVALQCLLARIIAPG